jgi:hypothetical protein
MTGVHETTMPRVRIIGRGLQDYGRVARVLRRPDPWSVVVVPMPTAADPEPMRLRRGRLWLARGPFGAGDRRRVVDLNAHRAAEEADGLVRWLRPEYQAPEEVRRRASQGALAVDDVADVARSWPKDAPAQYVALRAALRDGPATPADVAKRFGKAPPRRVADMLRTLAALGQAREASGGRYTP